MSSMTTIRLGLAANIQAGVADAQVTGYLMAQPTAPFFEVWPDSISYDMTSRRGIDEIMMKVRGLVGTALDIGAQKSLDAWVAPAGVNSVKAALQADPTLAGACADLHVTEMSVYRVYQFVQSPGIAYLGAEWTVRILATGF